MIAGTRPLRIALASLSAAVIALAVVGALAVSPGVALCVGVVAVGLTTQSALTRFGPFYLLVLVAAAASVEPLVAVAILGGGAVQLGRHGRNPLHPAVLVTVPLAGYILLGGANISTYRGTITPGTMQLILLHVGTLLFGIATVATPIHKGMIRHRPFSVPKPVLFGLIGIGLFGSALSVAAAGLSILHPYSRSQIGGPQLLLTETLIAGALLRATDAYSKGRWDRRTFFEMGLLVLAIAMPGFRGWPLMVILIVLVAGVYFGNVRVTLRLALIVVLAAGFFISGGEQIRRNTASGRSVNTQLTTAALAKKWNAQNIPPGIREMHFAFRETIGLTQDLVRFRKEGRRFDQSLLLGDFKTMLPGKQPSALVVLGEMLPISGNLGLTAGAVGVSYIELGPLLSLVLFFAVGAAVGGAWRLAQRDARGMLFYLLVVLYTVQWFHRGIPKTSYLVVPALFYIAATVAMRMNQRWLSVALPDTTLSSKTSR